MEWDYYEEIFNSTYPAVHKAIFLETYVLPVCLIVGTITNTVLLLLMTKLVYTVSSTCVYVALCAIMDIFVLYIRCGNEWLEHIIQRDIATEIMTSSKTFCKVEPFVSACIIQFSRWLVVTVSVEAFIAIVFPPKTVRMVTLSRAKNVLLLMLVLILPTNTQYFWRYELKPTVEYIVNTTDEIPMLCTYDENGRQYSESLSTIFPLLDLMLTDVIPLCVVMALTIPMVVRIVRGQHKGSAQYQAWCQRYLLDPAAHNQLQLAFCTICALFVFMLGPRGIFKIYMHVQNTNQIYPSLQEQSYHELLETLSNLSMYLFLSCKLFVFLALSCRVRTQLLFILKGINRWLKTQCTAVKKFCSTSSKYYYEPPVVI